MNDIVQGREGEGTRMGGGGGLERSPETQVPLFHKEDRGWGGGATLGEEAQALGQQRALPWAPVPKQM